MVCVAHPALKLSKNLFSTGLPGRRKLSLAPCRYADTSPVWLHNSMLRVRVIATGCSLDPARTWRRATTFDPFSDRSAQRSGPL